MTSRLRRLALLMLAALMLVAVACMSDGAAESPSAIGSARPQATATGTDGSPTSAATQAGSTAPAPLSTPWPIATSVDPSRRSGAWERPDEGFAMPLDEARAMLSEIDGVGDVIEAAQTLDIPRLLDLAEPGTIDCATTGRSTPQECEGQPTAVLPSVTYARGIDVPRPVTTMQQRLEDFFGGHTLALTFVAREGSAAGRGRRSLLPGLQVDESDPR